MKKVLFLTNLSTPYRVDFFNEFGKLCDLTVIFEARRSGEQSFNWNEDKISTFKPIFVGNSLLNDKQIKAEVFKHLSTSKYDAIIVGCYHTRTQSLAILYMKMLGIPYYLETDGGMISSGENILSKKIKRFLISGAKKYFSPSAISDAYLTYYGAKNIVRYPFTSLKSADILQSPVDAATKAKLKSRLGIKENYAIISIGQFIHRKGFDILLKAAKSINKSDVGIYIIGGLATQEYLDLQQELGLRNIHYRQFMGQLEIQEWLKACDLFVLPTREDIWGLVINEAMACGLPVITTDKCIAGIELIKDSECIVPSEDPHALAEMINTIALNPGYANKLSFNSLKNIRLNTFENMAMSHINHIMNEE
ncbi:glycosyltransferase family 4 protein [Pedobacter deserti]|uniref:glycosyltransferase family 4 protein n=1 Tax=Pedobacter deserti TaxID=2817382 RepID=UPI00210B690D|nr:glycosyltransferase family 4 protein [Pedobacter sp. SYSU D00382]